MELYFTEQVSHKARVTLSRNNQYLGATASVVFCILHVHPPVPSAAGMRSAAAPMGLLLAELCPLEFRPAVELTLASKGRSLLLGS